MQKIIRQRFTISGLIGALLFVTAPLTSVVSLLWIYFVSLQQATGAIPTDNDASAIPSILLTIGLPLSFISVPMMIGGRRYIVETEDGI